MRIGDERLKVACFSATEPCVIYVGVESESVKVHVCCESAHVNWRGRTLQVRLMTGEKSTVCRVCREAEALGWHPTLVKRI